MGLNIVRAGAVGLLPGDARCWQRVAPVTDDLYLFAPMLGFRFTDFLVPQEPEKGFEQLLKIFLQLVTISSGDVSEALSWLSQVDKQYGLTDDEYGIGDFIEDLKRKGYLEENPREPG